MTRAKRSMITIQNVNKSSQVTYMLSPPLRMKLRERLQNMKRYFPDESHKESNRTVGPPFRAVGSPLPIVPPALHFVNPTSGDGGFLRVIFVLFYQN